MKKTLLVILTFTALFAFNTAHAQWCGTVSNCTGDPLTPPGFEAPNSIPCALEGQAYDGNISFQMYSTFTYLGVHQIDSLTFDTLYNLPCGLCWSLNKASKTYFPGEFGCFKITGTTSDAIGQYNLRLVLTAYLSGGGGVGQTVYPSTVDAAGIKIWFRVANSVGSCTAVDTSAGAQDQVAATSCPAAGINVVAANIASVNLQPNPMNSSAVLSFVAEKNATYTVKITDVTGKTISSKEVQAISGFNTSNIERGNISAGVYLLSLSDGVSSVTRKFTVVE